MFHNSIVAISDFFQNPHLHDLLICLAVGFLAQMIDGTLGMAYKVSTTTFLLSLGITPAVTSALTHFASTFTALFSGLSHFRLGNVDRKLFEKLLIPGIIGGVVGAYILTELPSEKIKPFVAVYLILMGAIILLKALRELESRAIRTHIIPLGLVGGFFDAIGGGGWGPIVTGTLMARGNCPRKAIGSVNAAEFFVALCQSIAFFITIGNLLISHWTRILGLLLGGVIAAPIAAYATKKIPIRPLMIIVGILIIALSLRTLYLAF